MGKVSLPSGGSVLGLCIYRCGALFTVVLCVAATLGIQNGTDRVATSQIEAEEKSFQDVAVKIGKIKSGHFQTTQDYIDAYEQLEPLQAEFDHKLERFTEMMAEAKQRDANRGPLNIQLLYKNRQKQLAWNDEIFGLLRDDSEITNKQIAVAKEMAGLPEQYQVAFWQKNFKPLADQEQAIRQKIASAMESKPST